MKNIIKYLSIIGGIIILLLVLYFNKSNLNDVYSSNVYIKTINDTQVNLGSGFVYKVNNNKAYIITCYHVLNDSDNIYVYNSENEYEKAQLLNYDAKNDIAILYIDNTLKLKQSEIGNSDKVKLGDAIYALGTPLNDTYSYTLTHGIISYINRRIKANGNDYNAIQFDAPISGGNSGGVLLNKNGKVIGMIFVMEDGTNGISFAMPINYVMKQVRRLEDI